MDPFSIIMIIGMVVSMAMTATSMAAQSAAAKQQVAAAHKQNKAIAAQDQADRLLKGYAAGAEARSLIETDAGTEPGILGPSRTARQASMMSGLFDQARMSGIPGASAVREKLYGGQLAAELAKSQNTANMWAGGATLTSQAFQAAGAAGSTFGAQKPNTDVLSSSAVPPAG